MTRKMWHVPWSTTAATIRRNTQLDSNVDVSRCANCVYFITRGIGYVLCGYWKYQAQMATYFDEHGKTEHVVDCPARYDNSTIIYGVRYGKSC